jgi:hypothetical protein
MQHTYQVILKACNLPCNSRHSLPIVSQLVIEKKTLHFYTAL